MGNAPVRPKAGDTDSDASSLSDLDSSASDENSSSKAESDAEDLASATASDGTGEDSESEHENESEVESEGASSDESEAESEDESENDSGDASGNTSDNEDRGDNEVSEDISAAVVQVTETSTASPAAPPPVPQEFKGEEQGALRWPVLGSTVLLRAAGTAYHGASRWSCPVSWAGTGETLLVGADEFSVEQMDWDAVHERATSPMHTTQRAAPLSLQHGGTVVAPVTGTRSKTKAARAGVGTPGAFAPRNAPEVTAICHSPRTPLVALALASDHAAVRVLYVPEGGRTNAPELHNGAGHEGRGEDRQYKEIARIAPPALSEEVTNAGRMHAQRMLRQQRVQALAFSPCSSWLAVVVGCGACLVSTRTWQVVHTMRQRLRILCLAWSPCSTLLAVGMRKRVVLLGVGVGLRDAGAIDAEWRDAEHSVAATLATVERSDSVEIRSLAFRPYRRERLRAQAQRAVRRGDSCGRDVPQQAEWLRRREPPLLLAYERQVRRLAGDHGRLFALAPVDTYREWRVVVQNVSLGAKAVAGTEVGVGRNPRLWGGAGDDVGGGGDASDALGDAGSEEGAAIGGTSLVPLSRAVLARQRNTGGGRDDDGEVHSIHWHASGEMLVVGHDHASVLVCDSGSDSASDADGAGIAESGSDTPSSSESDGGDGRAQPPLVRMRKRRQRQHAAMLRAAMAGDVPPVWRHWKLHWRQHRFWELAHMARRQMDYAYTKGLRASERQAHAEEREYIDSELREQAKLDPEFARMLQQLEQASELLGNGAAGRNQRHRREPAAAEPRGWTRVTWAVDHKHGAGVSLGPGAGVRGCSFSANGRFLCLVGQQHITLLQVPDGALMRARVWRKAAAQARRRRRERRKARVLTVSDAGSCSDAGSELGSGDGTGSDDDIVRISGNNVDARAADELGRADKLETQRQITSAEIELASVSDLVTSLVQAERRRDTALHQLMKLKEAELMAAPAIENAHAATDNHEHCVVNAVLRNVVARVACNAAQQVLREAETALGGPRIGRRYRAESGTSDAVQSEIMQVQALPPQETSRGSMGIDVRGEYGDGGGSGHDSVFGHAIRMWHTRKPRRRVARAARAARATARALAAAVSAHGKAHAKELQYWQELRDQALQQHKSSRLPALSKSVSAAPAQGGALFASVVEAYEQRIRLAHERVAETVTEQRVFLDLSARSLCEGHAKQVATLLRSVQDLRIESRLHSLTALDLSCNVLTRRHANDNRGRFTLTGLKVLAAALGANNTLVALDLSGNLLGDAGLGVLARAMRLGGGPRGRWACTAGQHVQPRHYRTSPVYASNNTLTSLGLRRCGFGPGLSGGVGSDSEHDCIAGTARHASGLVALSQYLATNRVLTALDLSDNILGATRDRKGSSRGLSRALRAMEHLANALSINTALVSLNLARAALCDKCCSRLAEGVSRSRSLSILDLDGNTHMHDSGSAAIARAVATAPHISWRELRLGQRPPPCGTETLEALTRAVLAHPQLYRVATPRYSLGFGVGRSPIPSFPSRIDMTSMASHLGEHDMTLLAALLGQDDCNTRTIKFGKIALPCMRLTGRTKVGGVPAGRLRPAVNLSKHSGAGALGHLDLVFIGSILRRNTALVELSLAKNRLHADGVRALTAMLRSNRAIRSLNLRGTSVCRPSSSRSPKGRIITAMPASTIPGAEPAPAGFDRYQHFVQFAGAIGHSSLTNLDLGHNAIGYKQPACIGALADAIKINKGLTQLGLRRCFPLGVLFDSPEHLERLAMALRTNNCITALDLSRNTIGAQIEPGSGRWISDPASSQLLLSALSAPLAIVDLSRNALCGVVAPEAVCSGRPVPGTEGLYESLEGVRQTQTNAAPLNSRISGQSRRGEFNVAGVQALSELMSGSGALSLTSLNVAHNALCGMWREGTGRVQGEYNLDAVRILMKAMRTHADRIEADDEWRRGRAASRQRWWSVKARKAAARVQPCATTLDISCNMVGLKTRGVMVVNDALDAAGPAMHVFMSRFHVRARIRERRERRRKQQELAEEAARVAREMELRLGVRAGVRVHHVPPLAEIQRLRKPRSPKLTSLQRRQATAAKRSRALKDLAPPRANANAHDPQNQAKKALSQKAERLRLLREEAWTYE